MGIEQWCTEYTGKCNQKPGFRWVNPPTVQPYGVTTQRQRKAPKAGPQGNKLWGSEDVVLGTKSIAQATNSRPCPMWLGGKPFYFLVAFAVITTPTANPRQLDQHEPDIN